MSRRIIGVDPGSVICGLVVLDDSRIVYANNVEKDRLMTKITPFLLHNNYTIIIEDIKPYSLRLTPQVIDTCKFIGEAVYRLKIDCSADVRMLTRFEVKKWVFDRFPGVATPLIVKKIAKKCFEACELLTRTIVMVNDKGGPMRRGSFVYVDDKIVTEAMKYHYNIPMPPPGSGYQYGLKEHSWQALALATYFSMNLDII